MHFSILILFLLNHWENSQFPKNPLIQSAFFCTDCLDYYDNCDPKCETECKTSLFFFDGNNLLREDHCWSDFSYRKGSYIIDNQKVVIKYENTSVDYSPSDPSGKTIQIHSEEPFSESYTMVRCDDKISLRLHTSSYDMYCSNLYQISKDSLSEYKNSLIQKGVANALGF